MIHSGIRALRRHGRRTFLAHPEAVGETYFEHLRVATGFGLRLLAAGGACLLHGLIPNLCTDTGSRSIRSLHDRLSRRRPEPETH